MSGLGTQSLFLPQQSSLGHIQITTELNVVTHINLNFKKKKNGVKRIAILVAEICPQAVSKEYPTYKTQIQLNYFGCDSDSGSDLV